MDDPGHRPQWSRSRLGEVSLCYSHEKMMLHLLDTRILIVPAQANHEMRPRVWMLPRENPTMAATATKMAVQAPWLERAFRAVAIPRIPEPATKIQKRAKAIPKIS